MTNAFLKSGLFGTLFCDDEVAREFDAAAFTKHMLAFEAAWTHALSECDIVDAGDAELALQAIAQFSATQLGEGSDRDGLPVPALVAALKERLPQSAQHAVHRGATSQDVIDTAMMMTCISVLGLFKARLGKLVDAIDGLGARFGDGEMMARTRMQAALPATVSHRVEAWRRPLVAHLERVDAVIADLSVVQIGGPIGSRAVPLPHVNDCAQRVADRLGLALEPVWHSDRTRIVDFGNWMVLLSGTLGKIGQDVALMAQQGLDEISLKGGGGSSAMAHKQNPVAAETLCALARFVAGQQGVLSGAMLHEQERSGAAWALEWLTLPAMAEATGAALVQAQRLVGSVERMGQGD